MLLNKKHFFRELTRNGLYDELPKEVQKWAESLPWNERRYVLSLCYILCGSSPDLQAEFLDEYTADGLVSKLLEDSDAIHRVKRYLIRFKIKTKLTETVLRSYIRQYYIHSAQDARCQPDYYLESALKLSLNPKDKDKAFYYVLGFEILKVIFKMSWNQHERMARLQRNQEDFIKTYVKPIQNTHRLNKIIVPKDEKVFFASREYFIKKPQISPKKLLELIMATFTTEQVIHFGFSVTRHIRALEFDYDYIYDTSEPESVFPSSAEYMLG
jgi:hypothetical protein